MNRGSSAKEGAMNKHNTPATNQTRNSMRCSEDKAMAQMKETENERDRDEGGREMYVIYIYIYTQRDCNFMR